LAQSRAINRPFMGGSTSKQIKMPITHKIEMSCQSGRSVFQKKICQIRTVTWAEIVMAAQLGASSARIFDQG